MLVPELEHLSLEAEATNSRAVALCTDLDVEQLGWRSEPAKWSIAENLAHLTITTETFLPALDRAIAQARDGELLAEGPSRLGIFGRILVWYVEPPPAISLPAPKPLRPMPASSPQEALPGFLESQRRLIERINAANGLDLTHVRFRSPLSRLIRMNLLEFFSVSNGHARRHLWQAENVLRCMRLEPVCPLLDLSRTRGLHRDAHGNYR